MFQRKNLGQEETCAFSLNACKIHFWAHSAFCCFPTKQHMVLLSASAANRPSHLPHYWQWPLIHIPSFESSSASPLSLRHWFLWLTAKVLLVCRFCSGLMLAAGLQYPVPPLKYTSTLAGFITIASIYSLGALVVELTQSFYSCHSGWYWLFHSAIVLRHFLSIRLSSSGYAYAILL